VKKATIEVTAITACLLACAVTAAAQAPAGSAFLNIDVGAQPQQRTLTTSDTFTLYDEAATVTTSQPIHNGPMFQVSGGYRVWHNVSIGVGVSSFARSSSGSLVASIPDPVFVGRPRTVAVDTSDLNHTELGVHVKAVWFLPVSEKFDIALSAGPSFIRVGQDIAAVGPVPTGTQTVTVTKRTQHGTALGVNAGFDMRYMFAPRYGVGLFAQYAGGSVDLPTAASLKVGGFQTGLGLRLRF
jgi:hypothetical protein